MVCNIFSLKWLIFVSYTELVFEKRLSNDIQLESFKKNFCIEPLELIFSLPIYEDKIS